MAHVTRDFDRINGKGRQEYFLVPVVVMQHLDITHKVVGMNLLEAQGQD